MCVCVCVAVQQLQQSYTLTSDRYDGLGEGLVPDVDQEKPLPQQLQTTHLRYLHGRQGKEAKRGRKRRGQGSEQNWVGLWAGCPHRSGVARGHHGYQLDGQLQQPVNVALQLRGCVWGKRCTR